jgi:hypothetical protein
LVVAPSSDIIAQHFEDFTILLRGEKPSTIAQLLGYGKEQATSLTKHYSSVESSVAHLTASSKVDSAGEYWRRKRVVFMTTQMLMTLVKKVIPVIPTWLISVVIRDEGDGYSYGRGHVGDCRESFTYFPSAVNFLISATTLRGDGARAEVV